MESCAPKVRQPFIWILKAILRLFYPRHPVMGHEKVCPDSPSVFICNHLDAYGPIVLMLDLPFTFRPWVHAHVMTPELCRAYLEKDFARRVLHLRPPLSRWTAALIAPLCIRLMRAIRAIPVYRGQMRIRQTFNISLAALRCGENLLIFPENPDRPFTADMHDFLSGFVGLARQYHLQTGRILPFYPVRVNRRKNLQIGQPVSVAVDRNFHQERQRVAAALRDAIAAMADQPPAEGEKAPSSPASKGRGQ